MRHTVEEQIGRDPAAIALDKRIPHAALVATQVKYLARARTKLPSYYEARCILPPLAFEQASSEACAARKSCSGNTVLDLTCGLGVDALYLSKRFREVITLERDATLAAVAEENFRRLGATNIRVINSSAALECKFGAISHTIPLACCDDIMTFTPAINKPEKFDWEKWV